MTSTIGDQVSVARTENGASTPIPIFLGLARASTRGRPVIGAEATITLPSTRARRRQRAIAS